MSISLRTDTPRTGASLRVLLVENKLKFKTKKERKILCKETTKDTALSSYRAKKKGEHGGAHISLNPLRYTETFTYIAIRAKSEES